VSVAWSTPPEDGRPLYARLASLMFGEQAPRPEPRSQPCVEGQLGVYHVYHKAPVAAHYCGAVKPSQDAIRVHYARLGFFTPGTEWNPETGTYEPEEQ
jgi:hypothetical protein